ncbi:MAG: hypothetical protein ACQESG_03820 [Nanobdellota archaeon]
MEQYITRAGFKSITEFALKVVFPLLVLSLALFFAILLFLPLPFYVAYVFLFLGFVSIFLIPYMLYERKRVNINENIHLFITYCGTISTIDLDRKTFFSKLAENTDYGEISKISGKILYFAKSWNLGFAQTARKMGHFSPSRIFADFLDRFAAALDFGQDLETFMRDEQSAVLDDYSTMYKESLNNIGMLREAFIAVTISLAFGISTALLLPLLMGVSIVVAIQWSLVILFFIDMCLLVFVNVFIPNDDLCHNMKIKDEGTKKLRKWSMILIPISLNLAAFLFYMNWLSFLFNIAIAITPLMYLGILAVQVENAVFKRDKEFPSFIRALGATIYARQGGVPSSLEALQVHDFGILQDIVSNLYKRLKIGSDKLKSWYYFAGESGSKLISRFITIFHESIYLGGHAQKIGEMISDNFQDLISLRKLRQQQASSLKGALYGALIGFIATVYISVSITNLLTEMFSEAWGDSLAQGSMSGLISSIIPSMPEVDAAKLGIYLGLTVLLHSFVSALVIKIVDGGNRFAMLFDFIAMIWIGAVLSWIVPLIATKMFAGSMGLG